jgi:hypothetical protein
MVKSSIRANWDLGSSITLACQQMVINRPSVKRAFSLHILTALTFVTSLTFYLR